MCKLSSNRRQAWPIVFLMVPVLTYGCKDGSEVVQPDSDAISETAPQALQAPEPSGFIGFTDGIYGVDSDISLINPDGSGYTNLTNSPEAEVMGGWSPDGSRILFGRVAGPTEWHIWVMDRDGTDQVQLTSGPGVRVAPVFSPDGQKIAYMEASDPTFADAEVVVADADGSNPVNLTNHPALDGCARWSPDGSRILFTSDRDRQNGPPFLSLDLYIMDADGSNVRRLTDVKGDERCASWSPDGSRIAYGAAGNRRPGLYVVNADGSGATRIYADGFAHQPWWSPDGEWLVFHKFKASYVSLFIIRPDGSDLRQVADLGYSASNPIWSP